MVLSIPDVAGRYSVVHDYRGPRMRFGLLWFLAILAAMVVGGFAITVLFGVVATLAGLQAATRWVGRGTAMSPVVVGAGVALGALGAFGNLRMVGLVLVLLVVAAFLLGPDGRPLAFPAAPEDLQERLPVVAATLRCALGPLAVAVAAVQAYRIDSMVFLFLAAIVSVYDAGDYLIGAGYDNRASGPIAGVVACVAMTAAVAIVPPPDLEGSKLWIAGLALTVLAPLGQLAGSWMLPSARASAPALRRIDSWLLAAPAFLGLLWVFT